MKETNNKWSIPYNKMTEKCSDPVWLAFGSCDLGILSAGTEH